MGLSSSQARLLHLTSRMHQLEYKAAKLEAEKLQLANDSDQVYENYLAKLEQTKMVASVLSANGSMSDIDLTANAIYTYNTLFNQYSLISKDNKALIPSSFSNNYRNSDTLDEFLANYMTSESTNYTVPIKVPNPAFAQERSDWEEQVRLWQEECDELTRKHNEEDLPTWSNEWEVHIHSEPDENDEKYWVTSTDTTLATKFGTASAGCYNAAVGTYSSIGCYGHVLEHIIDYYSGAGFASSGKNSSWYNGTNNSYSTTLNLYDTSYSNITVDLYTGATMHDNGGSNCQTMAEVSEEVCTHENDHMSATVPTDETEYDTIKQKLITATTSSPLDEYTILSSAYYLDASGDVKAKTIKQWAIDLYCVTQRSSSIENYPGNNTFKLTIYDFHEALKNTFKTFDDVQFNQDKQDWDDEGVEIWSRKPELILPPKPEFVPTVPEELDDFETLSRASLPNKNYAQWLVNLWCKMEGRNDTIEVVDEIIVDAATGNKTTIYTCQNANKTTTEAGYSVNADWGVTENENYIIIPDELLNDPKWLRNALLEGVVLLQEYDKENIKFFDTSVSVTTRISEVQDEKGLKKAEAEYEADMKKIDRKDRYYDTQIAKVENERNATKEEMETLKNVAKENVDRTFKLFS